MRIVEKIILSGKERDAFDIVRQTLTDVQKKTTDVSLGNKIDDVLDYIYSFLEHTIERSE